MPYGEMAQEVYFNKFVLGGPAHDKKWTQQNILFWKIRAQKDLRTIKKGEVNKIENEGKNWYKMLENS